MKLFLIYLVLINLAAFIAFGIDKSRARNHAWRIPEKTLFLLAAVGGSAGAILGMFFFRHKTRHLSFRIGLPVILLVQIGAAAVYMAGFPSV